MFIKLAIQNSSYGRGPINVTPLKAAKLMYKKVSVTISTLANGSSTVVEHLPRHSKIQGLILAAATGTVTKAKGRSTFETFQTKTNHRNLI
jgi:hypothetical protein